MRAFLVPIILLFLMLPNRPGIAADTGLTIEAGQLTQQGWRYLDIGETDVALKRFRQANILDPGYAPAYLGVGMIYRHDDRLGLAIRYLEKALELDPDNSAAHLELSRCYCAKKDAKLARDHLEQAIKLGAQPGLDELDLSNENCP